MSHGAVVVTQLLVFLVKVMLVCSFQILIRWSLPRFRYDQVLAFAWKFMLPLALLNLTITAVLVWSHQGGAVLMTPAAYPSASSTGTSPTLTCLGARLPAGDRARPGHHQRRVPAQHEDAGSPARRAR